MAIIWNTKGGNCPERFNGAAIDSPSRMASRAFSITSASSVLATMFLTISIAVSSCTPLASSVASVLAKREMASMRINSPKTGMRSWARSQERRPRGVFSHRRRP